MKRMILTLTLTLLLEGCPIILQEPACDRQTAASRADTSRG